MNSKQLFQDFVSKLTRSDREEATAIGYVVLESLFGLSRTDVLAGKDIAIIDQEKISDIVARVNGDEPIQYILGQADFYGRKFFVTPSVLIPRPETEELVHQVLRFASSKKNDPQKILDIGTGSGCISVTLSLELPSAQVFATDISRDALLVAEANTRVLHANVEFLKHDILKQPLQIKDLDIVVSNPPYIAQQEKSSMSKHVVDHEPHLALFVSDHDPMIFYRAIANQSKHVLKPEGLLIVEINERFGNEVKDIFQQNGFTNVIIVKDVSGKDRIVAGFLGL